VTLDKTSHKLNLESESIFKSLVNGYAISEGGYLYDLSTLEKVNEEIVTKFIG